MAKINKGTFSFLELLREHNNREWFQENRDMYEAALTDVRAFIRAVIDELSKIDPHIHTDISENKCLFRIYRDTRFAKDKTPYKTWFSAGISVDGRKLDGPEYYLHIEHDKSFLGVGYWRPNKEHLDAIRQEIDYNAEGLHKALASSGWETGDLSAEDKLMRPPAGYDASHSEIEILKLKSFILYKKFTDVEMCSKNALEQVIAAAITMLPFKNFIHQAIDND
ncbi:DUF2461 domain-containing protein [Sphingobacterium sp. SYP-B4668]|uniref:DUF2461 domain-containing protein n=1 Tax=Sphingobacterium sp. SYP-B4668 TaxID=2996035 RepID=UPI0022DE22D9|nr:DUF2461 domain-containing protein [Sphingobacterium sp. SYP-B4668]